MIKRRRKKPSAEAEMKAFLASKAVDQISNYSQRGRSYRALSDEELVQSWQSVWNGYGQGTKVVVNNIQIP